MCTQEALHPRRFEVRSPSSMAAYVPVFCSDCSRASLSSKLPSDPQLCAFCEGLARVVPGPIYDDGDWLAFADIDNAIYNAELEGAQATALAEELLGMLTQQTDPQAVVQHMLRRLPELEKCRPALVNGVQRGLRLLATLLAARSREPAGAP